MRLAPRAPAAVALAAMVATPLARRGGRIRRVLANVTVAAAAGVTATASARRSGSRRTAASAVGVVAATSALEIAGSRTGIPFGRYRYTGVLRPSIAGVPAAVPLAWWAMALPAREVAHAALGPASRPAARVALGAAALTAWDLFLDPQMVGEGYWRWDRVGRYSGIPASNFAGWLAAGVMLMGLLEVALPVAGTDAVLVAEYAVMAVLETLGFAVFFRDRTVALVGGVATLPLVVLALRRVLAR